MGTTRAAYGFGLLILAYGLLPQSGRAQTTEALLSGRITNALSGEPISSGTVVCTGLATNTVITGKTDTKGFYTVPLLPPGDYELQVNASGFQAKAQFEIPLGVASALELDFALRPLANIQEPILPRAMLMPGGKSLLNFYGPDVDPNFWTTYSANAGEPGKLEASISDAIQPADIQQLPLEGNNIYSILLFEPGTTASNATSRSLGISANGQRPSSSNFLLDGAEANLYLISGPQLAIAPEAVQEYRLSTNNFSAEYGGAAGYIANAVTRAGGPAWHGQVYFNLENEILNANGFQDNAQRFARRPSKEDRVGFFAGGPAVKDRIFVGLSTEYLRTRDFGEPIQLGLPSTQLIQYSCSAAPASIACRTLRSYALPASTNPFAMYEVPETFEIPVALNRWLGVARGDYVSRRESLHGTVRAAVSHLDQPDFIWSPYPNYISGLTQPAVNLVTSWTKSLSPGTVNQFTAAFDDGTIEWNRANPNMPTLADTGGNLAVPTILPGSLAAYGLNNRNRTVDLHDEHVSVRGRHIVKVGGGVLLRHLDDLLSYAAAGLYSFPNVTFYGTDQPSNFSTSLSRISSRYQQPNLQRVYREAQGFLFVQDTFRVSQRLTLNGGLRYDNFGGPVSIGATQDPVVDLSHGVAAAQLAPAARGNTVYPGSNLSFAPRLGFAYDLIPQTGTLLRGGFGIFFDRIFDNLWLNARNNGFSYSGVGFFVNDALGPYNYLTPISSVLPTYSGQPAPDNSFPNLTAFQKTMPNGYAEDFFLGVQQPGPRNLSFELNGAGSLGRRLITTDNLNYNQLQNSNVAPINYISAQGISDYYSMNFVTRWRGHHGFLQAAYTWSHAIDLQSDPIAGDFFDLLFVNPGPVTEHLPGAGFATPGDSRGDRGNADFDQRQAFVIYGSLTPVAQVRPSLGRLLNGWTFSTVAAVRSGFPYSVYTVDDSGNVLNQRASVAGAGRALLARPIPVPGGQQLFPSSAFCSISQDPTCTSAPTGRNAFEGPGLVNFDLSVARRFAVRWLGEGGGVTLRADFFNALNHANLNPPGNVPGTNSYGIALYGTPPANSGFPALVPLSDTARRIQMLMRVTF